MELERDVQTRHGWLMLKKDMKIPEHVQENKRGFTQKMAVKASLWNSYSSWVPAHNWYDQMALSSLKQNLW